MADSSGESDRIKVGLLTVSDSCYLRTATDKSGRNLRILIEQQNIIDGIVEVQEIVPDELVQIKEKLLHWSDNLKLDLVLTTGGTGFAPRDVTPEATKEVLEKEAPGLTIAMLKGSLDITPMAMLTRLVCGIRGRTLILNLPGSTKGSQECLSFVTAAIPHAVDLLRERKEDIQMTHQLLEASAETSKTPSKEHPHQHGDAVRDEEAAGSLSGLKSKVDTGKVAHRVRSSPYPLISVQEAVHIVQREALLLDQEMCCFKDCLGRYLAQDVFAKDPLPPFPASIKDGYAVIASDGASTRRVIGELSAGSLIVEKLMAGNCLRINTGAPIPEGADSVVQVEDTVLLRETDDGKTELEIDILKAPSLGQDIRLLGSDISQGEKLLSKGQQLGPTELGLLATTGVLQVPCYKLPTVGVLSTGNELLEPTEPLSGGKIRDSNRTLLLMQLHDWGFPAVDMGIVEDSPTAVFKKLSKFLPSVDVIITTGGVSMGDKDYLKQVLEVDLKATIHFGRVFMKPGKPTTFATFNSLQGHKLLFCLPGNPVSAIVTCNLYVISALKKMAGCPNPERTVIRAKISEDLKLDPRPEYCRVVLTWTKDSDLPLASRTGNQISSRLLSMKSANGLLVLPPKSDQRSAVAKGDVFDAIVIGRL